MNYLWIETEAKLFCLLIIVFLWFFQMKTPQNQWGKLKYVYLFSLVASILSFLQKVTGIYNEESYILNLLNIAFGICCALTIYFWGEYAFGMKRRSITIPKRLLMLSGALIFGCLSYFSLRYKTNAVLFVNTLAMMVVFVVSQYNKIRIDNLTKLYNRYGMDEEIREQLQQYKHDRNNSFYIIACDLDNFKHINDTWGHQEGDRALVLIATALSKVGKIFDSKVFRIGGDEFIIITDTSEENLATEVVDAVKSELDNISFRDDFDIEMSMGVTLYDGLTHIDELLNNADKKLYQTKKSKKC